MPPSLPLEQKLGQMCMVGFEGLQPPDYVLDWLAQGRVNGVVLFSRNVASPGQLAALTAACHQAAPRPILIGIDQEGGRVARLRAGFSESPGALALGAADDEALAEAVAGVLARELRALGINWAFAPVVDIAHNAENPVIGTRSLGRDPARVAALALAQVRGLQKNGVAAAVKHFPGHGNTRIDTHEALAVVTSSVEELEACDWMPFRAAIQAGVASVMSGHMQLPALEPDGYPSTLSPRVVTALLRENMGFTGVTTTDCMEMKAVRDHYGVGESAVLAALAGQDVIIFSHTRAYQEEVFAALLAAAQTGRLSQARIDSAAQRVSALAERFAVTDAPDLSIIRAPEHLATMEKAARAGTVLLRPAPDLLPLDFSRKIALVEFASYLDTGAMEKGDSTRFAALLQHEAPQIEAVGLGAGASADAPGRALELARSADVLILATRSAHLWPDELALAREIMNAAQSVILLCLANPYDAGALPGARAVICTCGDATPSLNAAVDGLLGRFTPAGRLSVSV